MTPTTIFWPMLAHVLLVYVVYAVLGLRRRDAVSAGTRINHFKTRATEPEQSATASANIMNQFELPMLFHVACLALFATAGVSMVSLTLAWLFVLSRYVHAWLHLTSNRVLYRSSAFQLGALILLALWIWFALHLLAVV
jgi:hypothetical protein